MAGKPRRVDQHRTRKRVDGQAVGDGRAGRSRRLEWTRTVTLRAIKGPSDREENWDDQATANFLFIYFSWAAAKRCRYRNNHEI